MATLRSNLLLLARRSRPFVYQRQRCLSTTAVALHWNKDWKPGPIPQTPEERAAAAKKYGLRPEDYNCLVDKEIGDYPDLPYVAVQRRDPYEDYDFPGIRRNFREPLHPNNEIIGGDLWDTVETGRYTFRQNMLFCALIFFGFVGVYWLTSDLKFFLPQMPKQYPFNELYLEKGGDPALEQEVKHYTFEPAEAEEE